MKKLHAFVPMAPGVALFLLGGACNTLVRLVNGGMPVVGYNLGADATYHRAGASDRLLFLADRFNLPAFPGMSGHNVASIGDLMIFAAIPALIVGLGVVVARADERRAVTS